MRKRYLALVFAPAPAFVAETQGYQLVMEESSLGVALNGDVVSVTGEGECAVCPKPVTAGGASVSFLQSS